MASISLKWELARDAQDAPDDGSDDGSGNLVYVVFMEEHEQTGRPLSFFDKIISCAVNMQPGSRPAMVHSELFVPRAAKSTSPVHFATYIGDVAEWRTDNRENANYYLHRTAGKWRAVPVFGKRAAQLVRRACDESRGVEYSLFRYLTAAWGLRALAGALPDGPRRPAHCATLAARVLRASIQNRLKHPSAWYGPASLYDELQSRRVSIAAHTTLSEWAQIERLLRHCDEDVRSMSPDEFTTAVHALARRAAASGDVKAQKQLATALFRWSTLQPQQ